MSSEGKYTSRGEKDRTVAVGVKRGGRDLLRTRRRTGLVQKKWSSSRRMKSRSRSPITPAPRPKLKPFFRQKFYLHAFVNFVV